MKAKLKDVVCIITDKKSSSLIDVNNYVSTENILPNREGIRFPAKSLPRISKILSYQKNDVLVSNIRPYFKKIWFSDRDGVRSNDVLAFRTKNSKILLQKYLYLLLQSDKFFDYVTLSAKGTKMPRGDKKAILNFTFELPSISTQKKLTNYFFVIESLIKLNNLINDNLMDFRHIQYKKMMANSRISLMAIKKIYNINYGKALPKDKLKNHGTKVYGANGFLGFTEKTPLITKPSVTIVSRGSNSGYVKCVPSNLFLTNNLLYIIDKNDMGLSFTYEAIKESNPQKFVTGSAQPQLTIANLSQLKLRLPEDNSLITKFKIDMEKIEKMMFNNETENKRLAGLKKSLLNRYF